MNKIVLSILFLFPVLANGQILRDITDTPSNESNIIVIKTSLTDEEAFKLAGRTLARHGYKIDRAEKEFLSISTPYETRDSRLFKFSMQLAILEGQVMIRGRVVNSDNLQNFRVYQGKGMNVVPAVMGFKLMNDFAKNLATSDSTAVVSYATE